MAASRNEPDSRPSRGVAWLTLADNGSGWRIAARLRGAVLRGIHSPANLTPPANAPIGFDWPLWNRTEFVRRATEECLSVLVDASWRDRGLLEELAVRGVTLWLEDASLWPLEWVESQAGQCRTAGGTLRAGFPLRSRPDVREVRRAIDTGVLGDPGVLRLHDWRARATVGQIDADHSRPESASKWLTTGDIAALDLVLWTLNATPEVVWATRPVTVTEDAFAAPCEQPLQIHLGFPGGSMAVLDRAALPAGQPDYFSLSVLGTLGAAYADDHHNRQLVLTESGPQAFSTSFGDVPRREHWQSFVDTDAKGDDSDRGRDERLRLRRVAEAVTVSLTSETAVSLSLSTDVSTTPTT